MCAPWLVCVSYFFVAFFVILVCGFLSFSCVRRPVLHMESMSDFFLFFVFLKVEKWRIETWKSIKENFETREFGNFNLPPWLNYELLKKMIWAQCGCCFPEQYKVVKTPRKVCACVFACVCAALLRAFLFFVESSFESWNMKLAAVACLRKNVENDNNYVPKLKKIIIIGEKFKIRTLPQWHVEKRNSSNN